MKPLLVLQNLSADGPAYFGTWLRLQGLPAEVVDAEAGGVFPDDLGPYAGLVILGGEMSANDELPSLRTAEALIRQAVAAGKPTLGHCLGGQLMARALGGRVHPARAPEIGWQPVHLAATALARDWLGAVDELLLFQWHYEAFELPPGAQSLASSPLCQHQAFAMGPHLALQFHLEADAEKLARWSIDADGDLRLQQAKTGHPRSVQDGRGMRAGTDRHLALQHAVADRVYGRWLQALGSG
jgi:GMP synthase-like glutamine amidotransferase